MSRTASMTTTLSMLDMFLRYLALGPPYPSQASALRNTLVLWALDPAAFSPISHFNFSRRRDPRKCSSETIVRCLHETSLSHVGFARNRFDTDVQWSPFVLIIEWINDDALLRYLMITYLCLDEINARPLIESIVSTITLLRHAL